MNFEEFCRDKQKSDSQSVTVSSALAIRFGKPGGTSHSTDPESMVSFLEFLVENSEKCRLAVETEVSFKKESYTQYQEDPYRALYTLVKDEPGLNNIYSLGRSQTHQLTKVLSKFICFFAEEVYVGIGDDTFFDAKTVSKALRNLPTDLSLLGGTGHDVSEDITRKERFKSWLKKKGFSDKTIQSYSGSVIGLVDSIVYPGGESSIYQIDSVESLRTVLNPLQTHAEWVERNRNGNSMYDGGIKQYLMFLEEAEHSFVQPSEEVTTVVLPKPFLLLAGISGTGKTRFVRNQARFYDEHQRNFCLVPVRPDWHEPSELLGYVSRLSGSPVYVPTEMIRFLVKAWEVVAPQADENGCGVIDENAPPFWLCLDEMNLAPVEQYFADYLSVLETRTCEDGVYRSDPLMTGLDQLEQDDPALRANLDVTSDGLWQYFKSFGIGLPPNLIVAGTVNMDETTHGFSRKVIDRALTLDFGEFFPNVFEEFFQQSTLVNCLTWSLENEAKLVRLEKSIDPEGKLSIEFLSTVNSTLKGTSFELAYRALNELLNHVISFQPAGLDELQAVWDDFLMTKVLPRIEGDEDKLGSTVEGNEHNVLQQLESVLEGCLAEIWTTDRPDFFRKKLGVEESLRIPCRSRHKIHWMRNKLLTSTFTSYWP